MPDNTQICPKCERVFERLNDQVFRLLLRQRFCPDCAAMLEKKLEVQSVKELAQEIKNEERNKEATSQPGL